MLPTSHINHMCTIHHSYFTPEHKLDASSPKRCMLQSTHISGFKVLKTSLYGAIYGAKYGAKYGAIYGAIYGASH